jgi:malonate decarboxylase alpha subunit
MSGTSRRGADRAARPARAARICGTGGKLCPADADFLAAALAKADPAQLHDLHMVQSVLALPLVHLNEAHPDLGVASFT